ncbi:MAG: phosphatidate cytidylyltransferase [bacterium]
MGTLARALSAAVFLPFLVFVARTGGGVFLLFLDMTMVVALWEFYRLMEAKGVNPSKRLGVAAALILSTITYWYGPSGGHHSLGIFLAAFMVSISLRELFRPEMAFPIYDIATTMFGVFYVGWLMLHLLLLRELPREFGLPDSAGSSFVLYVFLLAWGCDTGAYFTGLAIGRHRLAPKVSPKKSVEGAAGGFLACVGAAFLGRAWFVRDAAGAAYLTSGQTLALGILVGVAAQLGDLVESLLKRDAQIKDTSAMIPGHGGVLDRFDSLLFSAPVAYYFLAFVVLG